MRDLANRIEVRRNHNGPTAKLLEGSEHISDIVCRWPQTDLPQLLREGFCARTFAEWRRGDRSQMDLVGFNLQLMFGNETKCPLHARIRDDSFNLIAHYLISKVTELDSIGGCVVTIPTTAYFPGSTGLRSLSR